MQVLRFHSPKQISTAGSSPDYTNTPSHDTSLLIYLLIKSMVKSLKSCLNSSSAMLDRKNVWLNVFFHHFHLSHFTSFQEDGCLYLPLNERDYLRTGNKTDQQERSSCYNQTDDDSATIKEN